MATPHISGVAALLLQSNPALTPEEVKAVLMQSTKLFYSEPQVSQGGGRIDALKAIDKKSVVLPSSLRLGLGQQTGFYAANPEVELRSIVPGSYAFWASASLLAVLEKKNTLVNLNQQKIFSGMNTLTMNFSEYNASVISSGRKSGRVFLSNAANYLDQFVVPFMLTVDPTPPVITYHAVEQEFIKNTRDITISWNHDEYVATNFYYRKAGETAFNAGSGNGWWFIAKVDSLEPGTYEYYIESTNNVGLKTVSDDNGAYHHFVIEPPTFANAVNFVRGEKHVALSPFTMIPRSGGMDFDKNGKNDFINGFNGKWGGPH